ncbi:13661_t:CDS:2 [Funneliformis caledonium]|uniref:13661_t:CDS:1 n=1 Tax=Funneliformis caledonium TaxID=1117310 RepID=A0A9N9N2F8_9GLOM|nr:13661_t:CDS:2 [Funneliformis caledonium]
MTKQELQKELKEKVKEGVKPSDIKKLKRSKSTGDIPNAIPIAPPPPNLLQDQLTQKQTELESLRAELEKVNQGLKETKQQLDDSLTARIAGVKVFGQEHSQRIKSEQELTETIDQASSELNQGDNQITKLKTQLYQAQQQVSNLQHQLNLARLNKNSPLLTPTNLETNLDYLPLTLYALLAQRQNTLATFTGSASPQELQEVKKVNKIFADFCRNDIGGQDINEIRTKLNGRTLSEILEENDDYETKTDELTRKKGELEAEVIMLTNSRKNQVSEKERIITRLEQEKKDLTNKVSKKAKQLDEEQLEHKKTLTQLETLTQDLTNTRQANQKLLEEIKPLDDLTQQHQTQLRQINALFDPQAKDYPTIDFNGLYKQTPKAEEIKAMEQDLKTLTLEKLNFLQAREQMDESIGKARSLF